MCGQGQNRTTDTRIFSPLAVARLCVTIGRYWYLFKRLTVVSAGRFYRFEHMVPYSSSKVVAKSECQQPSSCCRSHRPTEDQTVCSGRLSSDQRNEEIELRFVQVLDDQSVTQLSHEASPERVRNVFSTGNVDGVRFEVKSAAYLQSRSQSHL